MRSRIRTILYFCGLLANLVQARGDESLDIDLSDENAAEQWILVDKTARISKGELVLDGRKRMSRAFFKPTSWSDVALSAKFLVEPQSTGVRACGFVVRAGDASTYYYVHFDNTQAILVRSSGDESWNEIRRVSGLTKPAGQWHEGQLRCVGPTLEVWLGGKLLFKAEDARLAAGRIGFYANQGLARVKDIVVRGKGEPTAREFAFPKPPFLKVCEDAGAGGYEAFPDICRRADGSLMCIFYAGYGHVALPDKRLPKGGRISYCTSKDEGRTWSAAAVLYDGPNDDRDPSILQHPDGRLLCNFFSLRRKKGGRGFEVVGTFLITSKDGGRTWSNPLTISKTYPTSAPIRLLSGGRLIIGLYGEKNGVAHGAVAISDDGGKSWSRPIDIDSGGAHLDAETDIIELKDGSLYAAQRGGKGSPMHWSVSKDRGETWSVSRAIGFAAHCPYLHRAPDGTILLAHRIPQTSLHYSRDEGKTWSESVKVDTMGGAYPSMVTLRDGSILIVYYEEGGGSDIRAKRFRMTKAGVQWLRWE